MIDSGVLISIAICIVAFIVLSIIYRRNIKNIKWIFLFCLGMIPYVYALLVAIHAFFNGSGLAGDTGGFISAALSAFILPYFFWYIYIPASGLIVLSIHKISKNKKNNLH